jgi:hypothetical protein
VAALEAEEHRMDIVAWLCGLGLEGYAPAFRDNVSMTKCRRS